MSRRTSEGTILEVIFHIGACSLDLPRLILVDSGSNVCHEWTFLLFLSMGHYILPYWPKGARNKKNWWIRALFRALLCTLRRTKICLWSLFFVVVGFFGPCTWEPGRRVPSCRGGLRPFVVLLFLFGFRDFRRNGPFFRFTFSQRASPQLNGPVQHFSGLDNWLTGSHWPLGRRRKKKKRALF